MPDARDDGLAVDVAGERPAFTAEAAARVAREVFGVAGEARELPSDRDQNFRIDGPNGPRGVLKLSRAGEDPALLDLQHRAMALAEHAGVPVPRPLATHDGTEVAEVTAPDRRTHLARVLSWLPGRPLAEIRPRSRGLLRGLGQTLGTLDRALVGVEHEAAGRVLRWDLARGAEVARTNLAEIVDAGRRALVERHLAGAERALGPHCADLRRSVVHGDANDHNVLVRETLEEQAVAGLIDFGDLVHTWTAGELAIACAYVMLDARAPLYAAAEVTRGYHAAFALEERELEVLFALVRLRLCTSVAISAHQGAREPTNAYLRVSEEPAWRLLERLDTLDPSLARASFRAACGLEPCPRSRGVVEWLSAPARDFAPVLDVDPRSARSVTLDLSVASPLVAEAEADGEDLGQRIEREMRIADAELAVGRWDEARSLYASALFAGEADALEARTVHLGIDLFRAAGTPVHAPLDGVVHGLADNAGELDYGPTVILRHEPEPGLVFFTLYGHLARECLDGLRVGQRVRHGERIAAIGDRSVNGGWPPHLHFQVMTDVLGRESEFPGVAAPGEREVWTSLCPNPSAVLGLEDARAPRLDRDGLAASRRRALGPSLSLAYRRPLAIVRGCGAYLFDDEGRSYLDAVNNVPHVGHQHPRVVRAGRAQMAVLNTNTRYLHPALAAYTARLAALLPAPLEVVYLVCSGSEANELALRLARAHTGARGFVVLEGGYHGNTGTLVELSHYKHAGPGGAAPPPHVAVAPMPDAYRGAYGYGDPDAGSRYAGSVRDASEALERRGERLAGFLAEPFLGCGGQIVPPPGYLAAAYEHARAAGGVCIADEVQVGFGRAGSHFWAFETQGVVPDVVTLGKPIANGHPMGAVVTTRAIAESFANGMEYFNTFGGNPVSCAIASAVLDVIEEEGLQENALRTGARLLAGLRELAERHALVGDVRGHGLYLGAALVRDRRDKTPAAAEAAYVVERMKERGVLLSTDGPLHDVLKIKPPLVFGEREAERLLTELDATLAETVFG